MKQADRPEGLEEEGKGRGEGALLPHSQNALATVRTSYMSHGAP